MIRYRLVFVLLLSVTCVSQIFAGTGDEVIPNDLIVKITSPRPGNRFAACDSITIKADVTIESGEIRRVYFYADGRLLGSTREEPWEYTWKDVPTGIFKLTVRANDNESNRFYSDPVEIFVDPIEDGNLIKNGEFACDLWPWTLALGGTGDAVFDIEPEGWLSDHEPMAFIDILDPGSENWHVMIVQPYPIQAGHTYEISFFAEVYNDKEIGLDFQSTTQNDAGEWPVHYWQGVAVTPDQMVYGPYIFECGVDDPSTEFKFALSANAEQIYLDAVSIIDTGWQPDETAVDVGEKIQRFDCFLYQNHPNPFNSSTQIQFSLSEESAVNLSLYNVQGQLVRTLMDQHTTAGFYSVLWDGEDAAGSQVSSGIYIYRLTTASSVLTKRLLFLR
jgi:hypothetical protein